MKTFVKTENTVAIKREASLKHMDILRPPSQRRQLLSNSGPALILAIKQAVRPVTGQ